jgi:hypothetical protein
MIEHRAEAIDVRARPDQLDVARRLLRRHVVRRAGDGGGLVGIAHLFHHHRQAEVRHVRPALFVEEDV